MSKSFLYHFFGIGKIPKQFQAELQREGVILSDEGIKGSVTYINFRSPNRTTNWKRQWHTASIVLTKTRLLAFQYSHPIINIPYSDQRFRQLNFSLEDPETLLAAFDASLFHNDWSGNIEYRFKTPEAQSFLQHIQTLA